MNRLLAATCVVFAALLSVFGLLDILVTLVKWGAKVLVWLAGHISQWLPEASPTLSLKIAQGTLEDDWLATKIIGWLCQLALISGVIIALFIVQNRRTNWIRYWAFTTIALGLVFIVLVLLSSYSKFGFEWAQISGFLFQRANAIVTLIVQGILVACALVVLDRAGYAKAA